MCGVDVSLHLKSWKQINGLQVFLSAEAVERDSGVGFVRAFFLALEDGKSGFSSWKAATEKSGGQRVNTEEEDRVKGLEVKSLRFPEETLGGYTGGVE